VTGVELPHGFRCLRLASVASTNDVARGLADQGEAAGLFVQAERQTAGRGRQGRVWQSPPGNLYASLILRPRRPLAEAASFSLVMALALAETVEELAQGALVPMVKWPNDVLVGGAKLAGILLEGASDGHGGCSWLIAGMGVNVAWSPGDAVPYPTTDLAACGLGGLAPIELLGALTGPLRRRLDAWESGGFAALRRSWLARAAGLGGTVSLRLGAETVRGRLVDIDEGGAICLEQRPGEIARFAAGEVVL
jgi:BirA family biotin operon repressor/biotin-[acetyl-CoA-carboxylase] ligase